MTVDHKAIPALAPNTVSLSELLSPWVQVDADTKQVNGVQIDSRQVAAGELFLALAGERAHGLDYLSQVVAAKVAAIVVTEGDSKLASVNYDNLEAAGVALITMPNLALHAGEIVSRFYGEPSQDLKVIGVTGTDGKTSLCYLMGQALNENRNACGIIGTLGWGFNENLIDTGLTTPDAVTLQSALAGFREQEASYVAMEVSSHALAQSRVAGITFDVAVLTNLGRDHLDYHGDMQRYRAAKESLFYHPQTRAAVINIDDEFGNSLFGRLPDLELTTYGSGQAEGQHVRFSDVAQTVDGLSFVVEFAGQSYAIKSPLIGDFNVSNLTAVFAILIALGLSPELAASSIGKLQSVPGRMEARKLDSGVTVIVDYAHNPHALESVLQSVAGHVQGELIVVFGCGGDRDQGKRPLMAGIAEKLADRCIVTDDNPRHENGDEIIRQIVEGFQRADNVLVERDRRSAIRGALLNARPGDIVVVAGKGHEDYQLIGDERLPFSDGDVIAEYAMELAS